MKKSHGTLRCVCLAAALSAGASPAVTPLRGPRVGEVQRLNATDLCKQSINTRQL